MGLSLFFSILAFFSALLLSLRRASRSVLGLSVSSSLCTRKECHDKLPKRIYALDIDGAAVIKRVIWGKDTITLLSENKAYSPRDTTGEQLLNTKIIGLVG